MRFMTRIAIETEAGNRLCKDKDFSKKMEMLMGDLRPETAYFCVENGKRTLYCVVNADSNSDLPRIAEPFWLGLKASVEFIPAMDKNDFAKAATHVETSVRKFNWK